MRRLDAAIGLVVLVLAGEAAAAPAAERVGELVAKLKVFPADTKGAEREKALAAIDPFFDLDAFAMSALGASKEKLSEAQLKTFRERLTNLMRRKGYPAGAGFFRTGQAKVGKVSTAEGQTTVPYEVYFPDEDLTIVVGFIVNGAGKVVDVAIDGEPMTADYRNQFARVLSKKGADELLAKLAEKQKDIDG